MIFTNFTQFSLIFTVFYCFSLFFTVFYCFLLFFTVFYCFSLFSLFFHLIFLLRLRLLASNSSLYTTNEEYITQVSEEIEGRVTKILSQEFSRTESRILGSLSKLDEFLLNPQIRSFSGTVPGTSRNTDLEIGKPGINWGLFPE